MRVQSIHLENFRNYRRLDIDVGSSVNIFFGKNAQGKTNLIEAIYLCACARSHRTSRDKDLILRDKDNMSKSELYYQVELKFFAKNNKDCESVSIRYDDDEAKKKRRNVYHNGVPFERIQEYVGLFHAVVFAPEDLQLVKEGPSVRRRYLDLLISQIKPSYFFQLQRYSRLLIQRNSVIKSIKQRNTGDSTLTDEKKMQITFWDYPLAEAAAKIIVDRVFFSKKVNFYAQKNHSQISNNTEYFDIKYKTITGILDENIRNDPYAFEKAIEEKILHKLSISIREDCERGLTQNGPHRDDLELYLNGDNARLFASQGQQRSASLSLKLAEMLILNEETKQMPVLLLDDVFSELDASRRKCLLSNIKNAQVFLTCTDRFYVHSFLNEELNETEKISFFEVNDGSVTLLDE